MSEPIPRVAELLARDPFAFLAPDDPLATLITLHARTGRDGCFCKAWHAQIGSPYTHPVHVADAIRQEGLAR